ncbi:MAG: hypothetical protein KAI81_05295 [Candidatus Marinimicrobia bacterium]|nr:hypothetical protein [Candidatus Neomarinimicrobiota bacterium]
MFKAITYKEWIKLKTIFLGILTINLLVVFYIFLSVSHDLKFMAAVGYWNKIIFRGVMFYDFYKFFPLASGVFLALAQFIPEIMKNRIKLTFHLPIDENKVLLWMAGFGALLLSAIYLLVGLIFFSLSMVYFPIEITSSLLLTVLPWMLGGLIMYFIVSIIILEPNLPRRLFMLVIGYWIFDILYASYWYNIYTNIFPLIILAVILLSVSILIPGFRFRKGAR